MQSRVPILCAAPAQSNEATEIIDHRFARQSSLRARGFPPFVLLASGADNPYTVPMPADAFAHFVFVDFENVPDIDLGPVAGKPVHVTLLIGKKQTRLEIGLVNQIHQLAAQVALVEVGGSGRNALDLTLAYYLGQSAQRSPTAEFHVISRDRDFDPMLAHLTARRVKVARCDAFQLLPFLPRAKPLAPAKRTASPKAAPANPAVSVDKSARVIARLTNPMTSNRPATEKTLRSHVRTALGKESTPEKVEEVLGTLRTAHALAIGPGGKIVWPESP